MEKLAKQRQNAKKTIETYPNPTLTFPHVHIRLPKAQYLLNPKAWGGRERELLWDERAN